MTGILKLAWRNFSRHLGRYRVLLFALVLVAAALVMVIGSVQGMHNALEAKASRYFSGSVSVHGFEYNERSVIENPDFIQDIIASLSVSDSVISRRSLYYGSNSQLFASGFSTPQRRLIGLEWDREAPVVAGFDFVAGSAPEADDMQAILISTAAAVALQAQVGDEVIVSLTTQTGQVNTARVIIRGIFAESSFFGYTSYMQRVTLNRLMGYPDEHVSEMGVYLASGADRRMIAQEILQGIEQQYSVFPFIENRDQRDDLLDVRWPGMKYAVMSLDAHLAEITDLLAAISLIALLVLSLFLIIVIIGVGNTYSMIVRERQLEIGTLRALGLRRSSVVLLFLTEALYMGFFGLIAGGLSGVGMLYVVESTLDFSAYNWASLFMVQGRLSWTIPLGMLAAALGACMIAIVFGCLRSAIRAGSIQPVEALREAG